MRDQEIVGLYEAYASIYAPKEEVAEETEQLDEGGKFTGSPSHIQRDGVASAPPPDAAKRRKDRRTLYKYYGQGGREDAINRAREERDAAREKRRNQTEEFEGDLFDYILEYLVAEGYADTNKNAIVIMANMSEEWKQSILEAPGDGYIGSTAIPWPGKEAQKRRENARAASPKPEPSRQMRNYDGTLNVNDRNKDGVLDKRDNRYSL